MASTSNSNNVQSISLDLENLTQQYNNVLNFYNSVQAELNNYVNSPHPPNPYANTNIQFTTGEICYVTKNGVAKLYQDIAGAYSLDDDQQAIANTNSILGNYNNSMSQLQNRHSNIISKENNVDTSIMNDLGQIPIVGPLLASAAIDAADIVFDAELDVVDGQMNNDQNMINFYKQQLINQQNQMASDQQTLNTDGCPSISQVTKINLPWLPQYNNSGQIIPTNPPLVTGSPMTGSEVSQGLNCNNINSGNPPPPIDLITISNSSYTGGFPIGTVSAPNSQDCMTYCYTTPSCTGATYNSANQTCSLSSGEGMITPSSSNNTAIVPQLVQYLDIMIVLNTKLTNINNQIIQLTDQAQPVYNNLNSQTIQKKEQLKKTYTRLVAERDRIEKLVDEYGTLQDDEDYNTSLTNSNYLSYVLLIALAILVIIILMNIGGRSSTNTQYGGGSFNKSTYFVVFVIIVVSFLIYVFYSNKR